MARRQSEWIKALGWQFRRSALNELANKDCGLPAKHDQLELKRRTWARLKTEPTPRPSFMPILLILFILSQPIGAMGRARLSAGKVLDRINGIDKIQAGVRPNDGRPLLASCPRGVRCIAGGLRSIWRRSSGPIAEPAGCRATPVGALGSIRTPLARRA